MRAVPDFFLALVPRPLEAGCLTGGSLAGGSLAGGSLAGESLAGGSLAGEYKAGRDVITRGSGDLEDTMRPLFIQ